MKVSILIKAYNEEANIASAIESSLSEIQDIEGEVVVADSCSADRTAQVASSYPIRLVEFENPLDRGCGAGAQLAYQHSFGDYVYILDGDMVLRAGFLKKAIDYLDRHPNVFGVAGIVNDILHDNLEFKARAARKDNASKAGNVERLDCGGLYRREAIEKVRYFSDANLHSYEELDLGARLRSIGGILVRLNIVSADHYTHDLGSYELLWMRMSSSYALGAGEIFRASFGKRHFKSIVLHLKILRVAAFVITWLAATLTLALLGFGGAIAALVVAVLPCAIMALRRRSLLAGFFSVTSWFLYTVGFFRGILSRRKDPTARIPSRILREPPIGPA